MSLVQSVERALSILDLFNEQKPELKVTEISESLKLNKSTVHALLKTLQKHNYIEQNIESKKYKLGLKLFERGYYVIHNLDLRTIAKEHLLELANQTEYTLHLVILENKTGLYIDKVEGKSATVFYSRIGRRVPLHSSSVGKILLAFKKQSEIDGILEGHVYEKKTDRTILSEEEYLIELAVVREKGYAIDHEENEPGICCIAVPVRDYTNEVIAAISLSMPTPRYYEEKEEIIPMLQRVGNNISIQLGHSSLN